MRFEGLPGEFSQHDFGQVKVEFLNGTCRQIHFFASRLKYSRFMRVSLVKDETDGFAAQGGETALYALVAWPRPKSWKSSIMLDLQNRTVLEGEVLISRIVRRAFDLER